MAVPGPWITPEWPAPADIRALCTTRGATTEDGASWDGYRFFNLGDHVGDASAAVAANRAQLERKLAARPIFLQQVHGNTTLELSSASKSGVIADGVATAERELACTIMVADCLPILFTDSQGSCVAAAHAGWRGLASGVVEATLKRMALISERRDGSRFSQQEVMAWLGPCIGPSKFEVGAEVYSAFTEHDLHAADHFRPAGAGKYLADLAGLARQRLARAGVTRIYGNDGGERWCTVLNETRFFSYRRAHGNGLRTGRMAACIWRV